MLINPAESLVESIKGAPGRAKDALLKKAGDLIDVVKGSDSIREEIGKQVNLAISTPIETGQGLIASTKLAKESPPAAVRQAAETMINTTKNVAKLYAAPVSGAVTIARSGLRKGGKILGTPIAKTYAAFGTMQKVNEKLFEELPRRFQEWNEAGVQAKPAETQTPDMTEGVEQPQEKKKPALFETPGPGPAIESGEESESTTQSEPLQQERSRPISADESGSDAEKVAYSNAA